jgi:hypothetical protein
VKLKQSNFERNAETILGFEHFSDRKYVRMSSKRLRRTPCKNTQKWSGDCVLQTSNNSINSMINGWAFRRLYFVNYKIKLKQSNFERNAKNILGFEHFSSQICDIEKHCLLIFIKISPDWKNWKRSRMTIRRRRQRAAKGLTRLRQLNLYWKKLIWKRYRMDRIIICYTGR